MIVGILGISAQYPARPYGNGFFINANPAARPSAAIPINMMAASVWVFDFTMVCENAETLA